MRLALHIPVAQPPLIALLYPVTTALSFPACTVCICGKGDSLSLRHVHTWCSVYILQSTRCCACQRSMYNVWHASTTMMCVLTYSTGYGEWLLVQVIPEHLPFVTEPILTCAFETRRVLVDGRPVEPSHPLSLGQTWEMIFHRHETEVRGQNSPGFTMCMKLVHNTQCCVVLIARM